MIALGLIGARRHAAPQRGIRNPAEQVDGALHPPDLLRSLVEPITAAPVPPFSEEHRRREPSHVDRQAHLHEVLPVRFYHLPVDDVGKEGINMLIMDVRGWPGEPEIFPIANARHELNPEQVCKSKDWR